MSILSPLNRIEKVSKYLGRHSILHALWLLVLISYLNIAKATFEIVHCQTIGPEDNRRYVLVYDASVKCWSGSHLPLAILAVLLAAFLILPFPFYIWLGTLSYKLKPLSDVYTGIYKDSQRNWVVWNLLYRILIVLLGIFVVNFLYRHFSLLFAFVVVLGIFVLVRPYKCSIDNLYGGFIAICLVIFAVVTEPFSYEYLDPDRAVSWSIMSIVLSTGAALLILEGVLKFLRHKGHLYTKEDVVIALKEHFLRLKEKVKKRRDTLLINASVNEGSAPSKIYAQFREPLIDSDYMQPELLDRSLNRGVITSSFEIVKEKNATTSTVVSITNSLV